MEQDIEILEELLNAKITFTISTTDYGWKALEHLIKAYKELEEENENEFKRGFFTKVAENKANTLKIGSQVIPKFLIKETIEELKELGTIIKKISEEECILFLWVTFPTIEQAFEIIKNWGFTYKTCAFCWIKQNTKSNSLYSGIGHWTNSNAEICLLATKKKFPKRQAKNVKQVIVSHREQHSKKPDEIRERIIQLVGDIPRIELFARQEVDGWDCWGNEV